MTAAEHIRRIHRHIDAMCRQRVHTRAERKIVCALPEIADALEAAEQVATDYYEHGTPEHVVALQRVLARLADKLAEGHA